MLAPFRFRKSLAWVLAGLLLVGSAPLLASQEQAVEQVPNETDDEREDAQTPEPVATEEAASAVEAADDPAFNTLEDIVRLRAAAAVLLAQCRRSPAEDARPLTIAWRDVED